MSGATQPTASPSRRVVEAVADAEGIDPADLEPALYDVIDPTVLGELFDASAGATAERTGNLKFHYRSYDVTVESNGAVRLE